MRSCAHMRNGIGLAAVIAAAGAVCALAPATSAQVKVEVLNKPTSRLDFTSFVLRQRDKNAAIDAAKLPPGWVVDNRWGPNDPKKRGLIGVKYQGPAGSPLKPGQKLIIPVNGAGKRPAYTVAGDYIKNGKLFWKGPCGDPISYSVVEGGDDGTTYLGYHVPAGEYGYFYQMWNFENFNDEVYEAYIPVGRSTGAHNFQVLDNSFQHLSDPGNFDLQEIVSPILHDPDLPWEVQHYMEEEDALGHGGVPTGWTYDAGTGVATMSFFPDDPTRGLLAAETGSIVAYTSPNGPDMRFFDVASAVFGCPKDLVMVPVPTPGTLGLLLAGGLTACRRRRRG